MNKLNTFSFLALIALLITSCLSQKGSVIKPPKDVANKFVFIPMGNAFIDGDTIPVNAFWMSKYEVSNIEWKEFLTDLLEQGRNDDYSMSLPDSTKWLMDSYYNKPFVSKYFRHPAYKNYPVVNISYEAVVKYCEWLTNKTNSNSNKYIYEFRLPSREEWLSAAQFGKDKPYAWDSPYLRNEKGDFRANFRYILNEYITKNPETGYPEYLLMGKNLNNKKYPKSSLKDPFFFISVPVNSFEPSALGLYNMNGNVAEMVQEKGVAVGGSFNCMGYDIRNQSTMYYSEPSPKIGFRIIMTVITKE